MSDLTKCAGGDSPLCLDCWRRLAPDLIGEHGYQEWFVEPPLYDGGKCEEYWKVRP